jgi:hypothetical protein
MSYLGFTGIKLFINLLIIIVYLLLNRTLAMNFSVFFLAIYFVFLIFEIISLQNEFKGK